MDSPQLLITAPKYPEGQAKIFPKPAIQRPQIQTKLQDLSQKKINTLLTGPPGIGKSFILDQFHPGKVIRVDDFYYPKKVITNLILQLFDGDKERIIQQLLVIESRGDLEKIATKESAKRLAELALSATHFQEYTLIIDDLTEITKTGIRYLEKLKNHFHIIGAARRIKIDYQHCFSNFEIIEIPALDKAHTFELIRQLSQPYREKIQDYQIMATHIWTDTCGNPLFIWEMVERLSKEEQIDLEICQQVRNLGTQQYIDFSVPLIIGISSLLVLRYLGDELGTNAGAFRLLGGIALIVAFFSRRIFRNLKRRYL